MKTQHSIIWEGPWDTGSSFALVNQNIYKHLSTNQQFKLHVRSPTELLETCPPVADITVRHQWPPDFTPPSSEKWVCMQPWEYGALPLDWYIPMKYWVDEIWVNSTYTKECYVRSGLPKSKVKVIPLGVDDRTFHYDVDTMNLEGKKSFAFLFVGGTIARKGIDLLLHAYLEEFTAHEDVCLVIKDVGNDSFYKGMTLEETIEDVRRNPHHPHILYIKEHLTSNELASLYKTCDCLVHPYHGEGFGLPMIEAMACGTPIIAPCLGPSSDFSDENTAFLLPCQEEKLSPKKIGHLETVDFPWWFTMDETDVRKAMRFAYENRALVKEKGRNASRKILSSFTWKQTEAMVSHHLHQLCITPSSQKATHEEIVEQELNQGMTLFHKELYAEALVKFLGILAVYPNSIEARYNAGIILVKQKEFAFALQHFLYLSGIMAELEPDFQSTVQNVIKTCYLHIRNSPQTVTKPYKILWQTPLFNASGYAEEQRHFLDGLRPFPLKIKLFPLDAPNEANHSSSELDHYFSTLQKQTVGKPLIHYQASPANFFTTPLAPIAIGRTMFETDSVPGDWIPMLKEMTEIWVPSVFNYETFCAAGIPSEKIFILPEPLDDNLYTPTDVRPYPLPDCKTFKFLSVFDWSIRKGWDLLLEAYFTEFSAQDDVSLILKVSKINEPNATPFTKIAEVAKRLGVSKLPHIHVIESRLTEKEMIQLYGSVDAFVLPSRGEGWGRPYMEAMAMNLPTIGTRWSGQLDFMNDENSYLIDVERLTSIEKDSMPPHFHGHQWALPSVEHLRHLLRFIYENPQQAKQKGIKARQTLFPQFSKQAIATKIYERIDQLVTRYNQ
ncbi:glycosyltransferase family 4 protein [Aneurinibacillus uraniidurans]|uniref:glycosyltransferase family 4 protein n=1 Tax=Aneurinibacillus uraniidurans TaxID=2966586 RepID=UPI00234A7D2D|nr:glycosyltransferase [Aneurinibacillus sp. B1]WCN37470.1 glycosyltransferase [Aneurinibacillus sp. B1]